MNNFETIIKNVADRNGNITPTELETLSCMIASNALNRCIDPSRRADNADSNKEAIVNSQNVFSPSIGNVSILADGIPNNNGYSQFAVNAKNSMHDDRRHVDTLNYWNNSDMERLYINKNDDITLDNDVDMQMYEDMLDEHFYDMVMTDYSDFKQQSTMLILEYLAETNGNLNKLIEWKKVDKHVVYDIDYIPEYKIENIPATVAITRKMRKYVETWRSARYDETSKYSYVSLDEIADNMSDNEDIYFRTGKYADMGGYMTDSNGETWHTADGETVAEFERIKGELLEILSDSQVRILNYRLKGYSIRHIADLMNTKQQPIQNQLKRIQAKAEKIGLTIDK